MAFAAARQSSSCNAFRKQHAAPHCFALALAVAVVLGGEAAAQVFDRSIALPPAEVDELSAASAAHLENAGRFLAEEQWAEAVESLRRVQEADPDRLARANLAQPRAGFERYIPANQYCQQRLAALAIDAPPALAHYRGLVDPLAEAWFQQGSQTNDEALLQRVVNRAFASGYGDDALLKLGDLALARGEWALARSHWQRLEPLANVTEAAAPALQAAAGSPLWLALRRFDFAGHGAELAALLQMPAPLEPGKFPDSDAPLADVRARLALASLLEGSHERGRVELEILKLLHPEAEGRLGGRSGRYVELLAKLSEETGSWPPPRTAGAWRTLGGLPDRNQIAAPLTAIQPKPLWSYPLPRLEADRDLYGEGRLRVGEDGKALLSYHPVIANGKVYLRLDARGQSDVVALDLHSGQELWRVAYPRGGELPPPDAEDAHPPAVSDAHAELVRHAGVARYTLSVNDGRLMARMGSPVTVPAARRASLWLQRDQGFLLGLDVASEGKPLEGFPLPPESREWTFEGTPLLRGGLFYTAMRRVEGVRSQLYLAAFELLTTPPALPAEQDDGFHGRLRWRTRLCSSATLGGGELDQLTHLLVTIDSGRVYLNTSAGVVAAVNSEDGRLEWLVKYPRATVRSADPAKQEHHLFRDLTPCLACKDLVIVAPGDCEHIFALDAASGELAWSLPTGVGDDIVHLLAARDDVILASGDRLYWIDAHTGRVLTQYPAGSMADARDAAPSPRGFGRGTVAGDLVWWPTREILYAFDARPLATDFGWRPQLRLQIQLASHGATGGNLVAAEGVLLIAAGDRLVALETARKPRQHSP